MSTATGALIGQHFAFAHGRLGVLRQSLLNRSDMDRLLGAHDLSEVNRILTELTLTDAIDQSLRSADQILAALARWIRTEMEEMVTPSTYEIFNILWLTEDLPLLAYLLKHHHGHTSTISTEPETIVSAYSPSDLRSLVRDGIASGLPASLISFVTNARSLTSPSPETIDTLVAQYGANERLRLARASGSSLIQQYVRHTIDIQNIRTALRLLHATEEHPLSFLVHGGTIAPPTLLGTFEKIRMAIATSDLHFHLLQALHENGERSTALERGLNGVLASDIERMWDRTLGIEPPFAFAATTLSQLRSIRATVLGKKNALSPQDIKQILPPFIGVSRFSS